LEDIGLIQTIEQDRLEPFVLEDLGLVFASHKHRNGVFGKFKLGL
jgi:hypothetical protein